MSPVRQLNADQLRIARAMRELRRGAAMQRFRPQREAREVIRLPAEQPILGFAEADRVRQLRFRDRAQEPCRLDDKRSRIGTADPNLFRSAATGKRLNRFAKPKPF